MQELPHKKATKSIKPVKLFLLILVIVGLSVLGFVFVNREYLAPFFSEQEILLSGSSSEYNVTLTEDPEVLSYLFSAVKMPSNLQVELVMSDVSAGNAQKLAAYDQAGELQTYIKYSPNVTQKCINLFVISPCQKKLTIEVSAQKDAVESLEMTTDDLSREMERMLMTEIIKYKDGFYQNVQNSVDPVSFEQISYFNEQAQLAANDIVFERWKNSEKLLFYVESK